MRNATLSAAFCGLVFAGVSQAAVITTGTGPTYNYQWAAFSATAIDANVTVTSSYNVNRKNFNSFGGSSSFGIETWSGAPGPYSATFLYQFATPAGYMFTDASVFERRTTYFWGFDPKPTLTTDFSVDGGGTWTSIANPTFGTTGDFSSTTTASLNALNSAFTSGTVTNLQLRYVAADMRDAVVLGMFSQQYDSADPSVSLSGAGFIVDANISAIPEPASLGLVGVGGLALLRRRRAHA